MPNDLAKSEGEPYVPGWKRFLPELPIPIGRDEWAFVGIVVLALWLITSLPYLYGYLSSPPDKVFMGIMLDVPDHGQYLSWMRELASANLASNKLTSEPNAPAFFNLLWWILGRTGRWFGLDRILVLQIFRLCASAVFLCIGYLTCAFFLGERRSRRLAFLVVTLGSGFGWIWVVLKYSATDGVLLFPLDVFVAEGNTFLGILAYPHFIAAASYVLIFLLFLAGEGQSKGFKHALWAGVVGFLLGWQHAYDLVLVYGILGAYTLVSWIRLGQLPFRTVTASLIIGLISFWPALYSMALTNLSPTWKEVLAQFDNAGVFTPNLIHLPILMGPAFVLAVITLVGKTPNWLRRADHRITFLITWFVINFVLVYLPVDFQIHLLNGWQLPIGILATVGYLELVEPLGRRLFAESQRHSLAFNRLSSTALVLLIIPTNIYLFVWRFVDLSRHDYPFYLHKEEVAALQWLEANASGEDVVLSSLEVGQYIPAWTGTRAYLAHWAQTLNYYEKEANVARFFAEGTRDSVRREIVAEGGVDYVFSGPAERRLGALDPSRIEGYAEVFSQGDVAVFRVSNPPR